MNQGIFRLIMAGAVVGAAIWVFAVIGFFTVATTIGTPGPTPTPRVELLLPRDVVGLEIPDLPRYDGAARVDYRVDPFAEATLTEVEYLTTDPASAVRTHYVDAFERFGWEVRDEGWRNGEWSAHVAMAHREATVSVTGLAGGAEIEVRLMEPAVPRGPVPIR